MTCFHMQFETEQPFIKRAREAEDWFFSDDSRRLFSFVSVCDELRLEPKYIRTRLKRRTPSPPGHSAGKKIVLT